MKKAVAGAVAAAVLAACGGAGVTPLPTLDGKPAMVVAHRGASGYLPEEIGRAHV